MLPHNDHLLRYATERIADMRAESDRDRLARLVQSQAQRGPAEHVPEGRPAARAGRRLAPVQLP